MSAPGLILLLLAGCASGVRQAPPGPLDSVAARAAGIPEVRFRPVFETPTGEEGQLVAGVPGGRWDEGLAAACRELLTLHVERGSRIDAPTASLVAARAGYPGQVRFVRALSGGSLPESLLAELASAVAEGPGVDLGMASRRFDDGSAMWVVAWSQPLARLDPIPRDIALDTPLPLRVELLDPQWKGAELRLFLAPPMGKVEEISLTEGVSRWVDRFHTPGEHRLEVVATRDSQTQVVLLFSVFVDQPAPAPAPLGLPPASVEHPIEAEARLLAELNQLRLRHGLAPVTAWPLFEPLVREHSALMASVGRAVHELPGRFERVGTRARSYAFPFAFHHQAVATAPTSAEAMSLVIDSPAHLQTLLCEACTHATIGVALEPVLDRAPRLFVTWELMEFPKGPPKLLDSLDR